LTGACFKRITLDSTDSDLSEMTERLGSRFARELFESELNTECENKWKEYDSKYREAVRVVATMKKRPELNELDQFLHNELPQLIRSRSPPHILHSELAQIMKWKLTRGKFRPLQKLVESNDKAKVVEFSTTAFQELENKNLQRAFDAICQLKGVGVATASAIFAFVAPDLAPFMADEIIESTTSSGRDYNMRTYLSMCESLREKARRLRWDLERVGRALWTCAILSANNSEDVVATKKTTGKRTAQNSSGTDEVVVVDDKNKRRKK
jgi:hypothetical protein